MALELKGNRLGRHSSLRNGKGRLFLVVVLEMVSEHRHVECCPLLNLLEDVVVSTTLGPFSKNLGWATYR